MHHAGCRCLVDALLAVIRAATPPSRPFARGWGKGVDPIRKRVLPLASSPAHAAKSA